ncbi:MAG TPA: hypothetical protein ENJ82_00195 [Bacteroidetes bacterium]|nr:hypothetical protein [Bacteroidota bacterium]
MGIEPKKKIDSEVNPDDRANDQEDVRSVFELAKEEAAKNAAEGEGKTETALEETVQEEIELDFEAAADEEEFELPRLQQFTPSSMLAWGQFEAKYFQQIYTQTRFWNPDGDALEQGSRSTYYSGITNIVFGLNQRFNFGIDAWIQSVLIDGPETSPFKILSFPSGANSRTAITALGPKIKFQPFPNVGNFTLQSSLLLPVAKDPQGRNNGKPYLATENYLWWTQIFYTYNISDHIQFFGEVDAYWNINRGEGNGFFATPMSIFLSFFPTNKITLYVNSQFWPNYGGDFVSSYWFQSGIGGKYQFSKSVDIEVSYGKFLFGKATAGPANSFNLGLRFVKW